MTSSCAFNTKRTRCGLIEPCEGDCQSSDCGSRLRRLVGYCSAGSLVSDSQSEAFVVNNEELIHLGNLKVIHLWREKGAVGGIASGSWFVLFIVFCCPVGLSFCGEDVGVVSESVEERGGQFF